MLPPATLEDSSIEMGSLVSNFGAVANASKDCGKSHSVQDRVAVGRPKTENPQDLDEFPGDLPGFNRHILPRHKKIISFYGRALKNLKEDLAHEPLNEQQHEIAMKAKAAARVAVLDYLKVVRCLALLDEGAATEDHIEMLRLTQEHLKACEARWSDEAPMTPIEKTAIHEQIMFAQETILIFEDRIKVTNGGHRKK